jgi:cell division protein FtsB
MSGREQERRRRRGEPSGGAPSRRTDRVRRAATDPAPSVEPDVATDAEVPVARSTRGRGRTVRRSVPSRMLGRLTTRRAALLAVVVCALALSVAVPLHTYLSQRDDLAQQLQQQQALRDQENQLAQRAAQLSDPAQVEAEARTRLHFVMPGETPYEVQLPGAVPSGAQTGAGQHPGSASSWYEKLWNSIVGSH